MESLLLVYLDNKFRKREKDTTDTNNIASNYCPGVQLKTFGADDPKNFLRD